ncbi:hypothetical protein RBB77_16475 [Tunturibacter psychrotolerans]|uniref:Cupin type-1 domain-containing protein n=1 Tax=Tunturiibacter psychrotolerans TaxID=3069686 RepID=A0AAU7ZN25_9BACT
MNKFLPLVLLLSAPISLTAQQNPSLPPNYTTILTNDTFKVIRVHYGPHEKVPVHNHPAIPTVFVYLNNSGPVNIIHYRPKPFTITRPPTHLGAFRVGPGIIERHAIENLSDLPSDFLRVELPHLSEKITEFRGPAPATLTHNIDASEFSSPHLSIRRVLCVGTTPCTVPPPSAPSVLVAFSNTSLIQNGHTTKTGPGTVISIAPQQSFQISPATASEPAHILLISSR